MTTNDTVGQRRLLRNLRCLSAGSDSLYLQFKLTIWAQSYPRKHSSCTTSLHERHFPTPLRHAEKQQWDWNCATLTNDWATAYALTENITLNIKKQLDMCQEMFF